MLAGGIEPKCRPAKLPLGGLRSTLAAKKRFSVPISLGGATAGEIATDQKLEGLFSSDQIVANFLQVFERLSVMSEQTIRIFEVLQKCPCTWRHQRITGARIYIPDVQIRNMDKCF